MPKTKEPPHGYDDHGRQIWALGEVHGRPVCGAKLRKREGTCQSEARMDNGRCKSAGHGGGSTGRPLAENPKPDTVRRRRRTKLYKSLRLADRVEAARADPELKSHAENIALIEALIEAEGDEEVAPSHEIWKEARKLYDAAVKGGDTSSLLSLGKVLQQGCASSERVERLVNLMEQQRKHIESEAKRERDLQTTLTARQVQFFGAQLLAIIQEEEKDPAVLRAISIRFAKLFGFTDS